MKVGPIEKNIPVWKYSPKYPIGEMEIGDSFLAEPEAGEDLRILQNRMYPRLIKHARELRIRLVTRIMKDQNGVREWRVESNGEKEKNKKGVVR